MVAVPLPLLQSPEGDTLSPQLTGSWGTLPVPGWQQGLVTSLMLFADLQISGMSLLEGDIPCNGRTKTTTYKERKSSSELLSLSVIWHQAWVARSAHRHCSLPLFEQNLQTVPRAVPDTITPSQGPPADVTDPMQEEQPGTAHRAVAKGACRAKLSLEQAQRQHLFNLKTNLAYVVGLK